MKYLQVQNYVARRPKLYIEVVFRELTLGGFGRDHLLEGMDDLVIGGYLF